MSRPALLASALLLSTCLVQGHTTIARADGARPAILIGHLRLDARVKAKEQILRGMLSDALISSGRYTRTSERAAAEAATACRREGRPAAVQTCWRKAAGRARAPFFVTGQVEGDGAVCHVRVELSQVRPPTSVRTYAQSLAPCDRKALRVEMQRAGQALAAPGAISTVGGHQGGGEPQPRSGPGRSVAGMRWVRIPGGSFMMGRDHGNSDERPAHRVQVPDFEILKTEVTVAMYRACVKAGGCDTHQLDGSERTGPGSYSRTHYCNWNHSDREDHPLNCVSHKQALAFARWVGGGARLCSEAEFEYAARSGGREGLYPWGDAEPTCELTIMSDGGDGCGVDRTWPACSRPDSNTSHGVCDLAGNVREWVADQYHDDYSGAPTDGSAWMEPTGKDSYREGCWVFGKDELHVYSRDGEIPGYSDFDHGFRVCRGPASGSGAAPSPGPGPAAAFTGPPRADRPTWVDLPGGTYRMGRSGGNSDERPVHQVRVPPFAIMQTEVTVAMYRACVSAGACDTHRLDGSERSGPGSYRRTDYCNWNHRDREDHPLNCVTHKQALDYGRWVGGGARLCSEAEFEFAARSGGRDILYPWGDDEPTCQITIMSDGGDGCGVDRTWPICSRPAGNSAQGVCDLAGNVREWVADQYHTSYAGAPTDGSAWMDPTGKDAYREGCWVFKKDELHAYSRDGEIPGYGDFDQGFRLCRSAR